MQDKIAELKKQHQEINQQLSQIDPASDLANFQKLSRAFAELEKKLALAKEFEETKKTLLETEKMVELEEDEEMRLIAEQEVSELRQKKENLAEELEEAL